MLSYIWLEMFLVCANTSAINPVGLYTYFAYFACSHLLFLSFLIPISTQAIALPCELSCFFYLRHLSQGH